LDNFLFIWKVWRGAMFVTIPNVVMLITAFSITKKPMKNRKKNGPNHGNTNTQQIYNYALPLPII
jgi:hypothetical protein